MKRAFSLVELSIVLVILGLLVGGVLAGQSLIRAAQLRAVTTEYQRYYTATQSFKDKYFAIPGDFRDATRFWGLAYANYTSPVYCVSNSGAAVTGTSTGTCDGDGNGSLTWFGGDTTQESLQFWRQLALAGMIEGQYNGLPSPGSIVGVVPGTDVPASKYTSGGWAISQNQNGGGMVNWTPSPNYNSYVFGLAGVNVYTAGALLTPTDAWNIDTKMDDGLPGTGFVHGTNWYLCVSTPGTNAYSLTSTAIGCYLEFTKGIN